MFLKEHVVYMEDTIGSPTYMHDVVLIVCDHDSLCFGVGFKFQILSQGKHPFQKHPLVEGHQIPLKPISLL